MTKNKASLLFIVLVSLSVMAQENADQQLFESVFSKKNTKNQHLELPLYNHGVDLGALSVIVSSHNQLLKIDTSGLLKRLEEQIEESSFKQLKSHVSQQKWISLPELIQQKINIQYDYTQLTLKLIIPVALQRAQSLDFDTEKIPRWVKDPVGPSKFSAYTNFHYYQTFSSQHSNTQTVDVRSVFDFNQTVLEMNGSHYNNGENNSYWQREDIWLTRDNKRNAHRYSVGDLQYQVRGFQTYKPIMGLQFSKEYGIRPYSTIYPHTDYEFILKERSTVDLYINSHLVRTLTLAKGKHSLKDLPLNQGINDVSLKIKDQTGREETINFPATMSFNLLRKGLHNFSYSLGLQSHLDGTNSKVYETDNPIFNAHHYYGLTDSVTLGQYAQWEERYLLAGSELIFTTPWGELAWDNAFSNALGHLGIASELRYRLNWYTEGHYSPYDFSIYITHKSPWFLSFDQVAQNSKRLSLSFNLGGFIFDSFYLRLGGRWETTNTVNESDFTEMTLSINKMILSNLNLNLQLTHRNNFDTTKENGIALYLNWSFPSTGNNITSSYDSILNSQNVAWSYNQAKKSDKYNTRVELAKNGSSQKLNAQGEYVHDRFTAYLTNESTEYSNSWQHQQKININSAVVYSGGHWSMSKPITESFVLIPLHKGFKKYTLRLNDSTYGYDSSSAWFNDLILSDVQDYRYKNANVNSLNLPVGYSLKKDNLSFATRYHSGTVYVIDEVGSISVIAILYYQGTPMALQSGELRDSKTGNTYPFFTNRKARFFVAGISAGTYDVFSYDADKVIGKVNIDEKDRGIINLGVIKL